MYDTYANKNTLRDTKKTETIDLNYKKKHTYSNN